MRKSEEAQGKNLVFYTAWVILGGVAALIVCLIILLVASVCIAKGMLREEYMHQIALVACVLGGIFGGHMAVKHCGARNLLVGVAAGLILFLILLTVGMLSGMLTDGGGGTIGTFFSCLCGGAVAGLLGSKGVKSKKKRRK